MGILNFSVLSTHLHLVLHLIYVRLSAFSYAYIYLINSKAISENIIMIRDVINKSFFLILSPPFLRKLANTQQLGIPNTNVYQYLTYCQSNKKRWLTPSFYILTNISLPTPHIGHFQSSGRSSNLTFSLALS